MQILQEQDIDYILHILAHPEMELTAEFRLWLDQPGHKELYLETKAAHDALALKELPLPDVNREWARLQVKPYPSMQAMDARKLRRHRFYRIVAIAACLALVVAVGWPLFIHTPESDTMALVQQDPAPQEVMLSSAQGRIVLSSQVNADSLNRISGASLSADRKLNYHTDKVIVQEKPAMQVLQTPRGKDFKIVLSDGTEVWLNAESRLEYPGVFNGTERVVTLDGEAYFHVAKDSKHPFIVRTSHYFAEVLGTGFNFRAYHHSLPQITLVEGKLAARSEHYHILLNPGENAILNADGTIRIEKVDTRSFTAWTEGYFYFDNASLEEILRELGRWYNLTIEVERPEAMKYHFNFWASRRDPIESVAALMNELGKVRVEVDGHTLTIK